MVTNTPLQTFYFCFPELFPHGVQSTKLLDIVILYVIVRQAVIISYFELHFILSMLVTKHELLLIILIQYSVSESSALNNHAKKSYD